MNRTIAALIALFISASPVFSSDGSIGRELLKLGASGFESAGSVPVPDVSGLIAEDTGLAGLQREAAEDPEGFIDSHTPFEVSLAFGLMPSRFQVADQQRIAGAAVKITVNLSLQTLNMQAPGGLDKTFKISSGLAPEHGTPGSGHCYAPDFIQEMHYSTLYKMAPMPNSVFFNGNIAMHGTNAEQLLGHPASHGCIRLSKANSRIVYDTVKANGKGNTIVCVKGVTPLN